MLEPFVKYAKDPPDKAKRRYLRAYASALCILNFAALFLLEYYFDFSSIVISLFAGVINFMFLATFLVLNRRSKRYSLDSKKEICTDPRAPILYLRPFYYDPPDLPLVILPFIRTSNEYYKMLFKKTPEEALTKLLQQLGPVVAVGRPGEELPPLGAIRFYFNDGEWQEKVDTLMSLSQLVVIQASYSTGVEWEMKLAKARLQPEQLLFSFLSWQTLSKESHHREYEIFKMQFERIYSLSLPKQIGNAFYLYFDNDWTPHFDYKDEYVNEALTSMLAERYGLEDDNKV